MLPPGKFTPSVEFNVLEFHLNISLWERERARERQCSRQRQTAKRAWHFQLHLKSICYLGGEGMRALPVTCDTVWQNFTVLPSPVFTKLLSLPPLLNNMCGATVLGHPNLIRFIVLFSSASPFLLRFGCIYLQDQRKLLPHIKKHKTSTGFMEFIVVVVAIVEYLLIMIVRQSAKS